MKCEKCGQEIDHLLVDTFMYDGSDQWLEEGFEEAPVNAVVLRTNKNWTGYELSEEEMRETVVCPNCKKWPFECESFDIYEPVELVMFKREVKPQDRMEQLYNGMLGYLHELIRDPEALRFILKKSGFTDEELERKGYYD